MFNIVLLEPEIPPNTGNIIRLCANIDATLHLIYPLGFRIEDRQLQRAGLDYRHKALIRTHQDFRAFLETEGPHRLFAYSTKGQHWYSEVEYQKDDYFLFGPETRGLPDWILNQFTEKTLLRIPMVSRPNNRSLNLNNAVAVVAYEAWRQIGYKGAT